ncbi:MAG TPA: helix-turn-helix domain-containing protein [Candidatus Paceibacterota bacterium]
MLNRYYSTTETAEILKITRVTVFNWIKSGNLKARRFGRSYLIPVMEIERVQKPSFVPPSREAQLRQFSNLLATDYSELIKSLN